MTIKKVTKSVLEGYIKSEVQKALMESSIMSDMTPGDDKTLGKFMGKVETMLTKFSDEAQELMDEGEKMTREVLTPTNGGTGERNRALLQAIGLMKKLRDSLVRAKEVVHKGTGYVQM